MRTRIARIIPIFFMLTLWLPRLSLAEQVLEIPVLAAIPFNQQGIFEVLLVRWDKKAEPSPVRLQWILAGVKFGDTHLGAMADAFSYAVNRTPPVRHSGTVSVQGIAYQPVGSDGPSAGAVMAVGFLALFNGDTIQRGIALTGTLETEGRIGRVGNLPDKIRAAKREGYRTVLVPRGQIYDPQWNLQSVGFELNIDVKEVDTIDDAYLLMTGRRP